MESALDPSFLFSPDFANLSPGRPHEAAKAGDIGTIEAFVAGGGDADELDERGFTPLFWAIHRKKIEVVRYLVTNVDGKRADLAIHINGRGYLDYSVSLGIEAAPISAFLLNEASIAFLPAPDGEPIINALTTGNQTALTTALRRNDDDTAILLLEHGIDPNLGHTDNSGLDPLCHALYWNKSASLVEALVFAGAKVDAEHNFLPCLFYATRGGDVAVVNTLLLVGGGNPATTFSPSGPSLYYDAVRQAQGQGPIDVVRAIMESGRGVNINEVQDAGDEHGRMTALDWALEAGNGPLVDYLEEQGALVADQVDRAGLDFLIDLVSIDDAEYLTQLRAMDVNMRSSRGNSLIHAAVSGEDIEMVENLISYGANPNLPDPDGMAPLHYAVSFGSVEIVLALLDAGASVCLPEPSVSATPLHVAVAEGNVDMIELLLDNGAWDCVNNPMYPDGRTPLHLAAVMGNVPAARLLLSLGADGTIRDATTEVGKTPWELAREMGHGSFQEEASR